MRKTSVLYDPRALDAARRRAGAAAAELARYPDLLAEQAELLNLVQGSGPRAHEHLGRLLQLLDRVGAIVAPFVVCGPRCAACCTMPTLISGVEAQILSERSGRPVTRPSARRARAAGDAANGGSEPTTAR